MHQIFFSLARFYTYCLRGTFIGRLPLFAGWFFR